MFFHANGHHRHMQAEYVCAMCIVYGLRLIRSKASQRHWILAGSAVLCIAFSSIAFRRTLFSCLKPDGFGGGWVLFDHQSYFEYLEA